jgi:RNA polymerase sigma factor (sigma-70 family)
LVRREIAKLPEKQGQAVVMRYIDQRDYQTIAGKLNCTEDTVRSHVSKAVATLREKLAHLNIWES